MTIGRVASLMFMKNNLTESQFDEEKKQSDKEKKSLEEKNH